MLAPLRMGFLRQRDVVNKLAAKLIEQLGLHELVIIGDVKTNDFFALHGLGKLSFQSIGMGFFHAKNDVGPTHVTFRDDNARVGLRANGANLIVTRIFEQLFGCKTAQSVTTAHEE